MLRFFFERVLAIRRTEIEGAALVFSLLRVVLVDGHAAYRIFCHKASQREDGFPRQPRCSAEPIDLLSWRHAQDQRRPADVSHSQPADRGAAGPSRRPFLGEEGY